VEEQDDEELWPPSSLAGRGGRKGRDQRVHAHVRELRGRGRTGARQARSLSRGEIVRAAVAVADAEGADAISMRRIARELGAGTMSLYWHIASKEELLDLMLDAVQGEMEAPEPSGDWRADLAAIGRNARSTLYRHGWVMDFMMGRPPFGPNMLRNAERNLAALDGLGLDKATAMNILMTVVTYVLGAVLRELQEMRGDRDVQRQVADLGETGFGKLRDGYIQWLRASGRYPRLVQMIDEGFDPDAAETRDERFEFGLGCVIDGIAARLAQRRDGRYVGPA
jgi:AcrR family transcriptional regulator